MSNKDKIPNALEIFEKFTDKSIPVEPVSLAWRLGTEVFANLELNKYDGLEGYLRPLGAQTTGKATGYRIIINPALPDEQKRMVVACGICNILYPEGMKFSFQNVGSKTAYVQSIENLHPRRAEEHMARTFALKLLVPETVLEEKLGTKAKNMKPSEEMAAYFKVSFEDFQERINIYREEHDMEDLRKKSPFEL